MTDKHTCSDIEDKLALLVYDELPSDELPEVQAHVDACNACNQIYKDLKGSASLLEESTTSLPPLSLSDEERSKILVSILEEESSHYEGLKTSGQPSDESSSWNKNVLWLIVAVVVVAIGLGLFFLLK